MFSLMLSSIWRVMVSAWNFTANFWRVLRRRSADFAGAGVSLGAGGQPIEFVFGVYGAEVLEGL